MLFLGEWCKLYDRREIWSKYNYEDVPYHWDDRAKLCKDYSQLNKIYELILNELTYVLNSIHGVDNSVKYWRTLVGIWLGWFIHQVFDRWFMLKFAVDNYSNLNCILIRRDALSLAQNDMFSFAKKSTSDIWNEGLYSQLIDLFFKNYINITKIDPFISTEINSININTFSKRYKLKLKNVRNYFNKIIGKNNDYLFHNSYLDKFD